MTRLRKTQVEALLTNYDSAPIDTLTTALRIALDAPTLDWAALVVSADLPHDLSEGLRRGDPAALDQLAAELNELREVARVKK